MPIQDEGATFREARALASHTAPMIIDGEDVEEAMRALAVDARLCSSNEVTRRLSSLLVGYSQADVCLGGAPGMGGGVATIFRGRIDKPSTVSDMSYPPFGLARVAAGRCHRPDERAFFGRRQRPVRQRRYRTGLRRHGAAPEPR